MYMTKNVLRNLFKKSATRLYPLEKREIFENVRGALDIEIDKCIFCRACQLRCPSQCITVDNKAGTWTLDPMACVVCGVCVAVCPKKCLHIGKQYRAPLLERGLITHQGTPRVPKPKAAVTAPVVPAEQNAEAEVQKAAVATPAPVNTEAATPEISETVAEKPVEADISQAAAAAPEAVEKPEATGTEIETNAEQILETPQAESEKTEVKPDDAEQKKEDLSA